MYRARLIRTLGFCLLLVAAASLAHGLWSHSSVGTTAQAQAQEEGGADAGGGAAGGGEGGAPAAPAKKPKNMLVWVYEALGWRYTIAFLGLSFAFVALLIMCLLTARRDQICPSQLVEAFEAHVTEKRYQEAYELAKSDESVLGKVLAAGMARLQDGPDSATKAMQEMGEDENMRIEHRLSYLALIGTLAPMVGLLGTVDGMVASFTVIAESETTPKPSELATGISMALVTTLAGLVIAIPAIAVFNILKNRIARMMLETGMFSDSLISRLQTKK